MKVCPPHITVLLIIFWMFALNSLGLAATAIDPQVDQLYEELNEANSDSIVLRLELQLSDSLLFFQPDSAMGHAKRALHLAKKNLDTLSCAEAYNNIGIVATIQGKYLTGTEYFQEALHHYESAGNLEGASKILNNLGVIYQTLEDYQKSIQHHREGVALDLKLNDHEGVATNLYNIAVAYLDLEQSDSCWHYINQLNAYQRFHQMYVSPTPIIGAWYLNEGKLDSAQYFLEKALIENETENDETRRISSILSLSEVMLKRGKHSTALQKLASIESSIEENGFNDQLMMVYQTKSDIYQDLKQFEKALMYKEAFIELKDSLDELNNYNRISELNAKYESEKTEKELAEKEAMLIEQQINEDFKSRIFIIIILCFIIVAVILLVSYLKGRKTNHILNQQNAEINDQRHKIISSINYAKKIQNSILIPEKQIRRFLPESFVYFKPKDIVSGDFYWFSQIGDKCILATIDCTGHGVPGAFMSLIANAKLNKVVNEKRIYDPGLILSEVHHEIFKALNQEESKSSAQDGMDMSLCVIDQVNKQISFAGAQNSIYLINDHEAKEIKADSYSIGGNLYSTLGSASFNTKNIPYEQGTCLYMFTDGYVDQFGGTENKKLNKSRFKEMLINLSSNGLSQAKLGVEQYFQNWKGSNKQIDDVLLIGTRL